MTHATFIVISIFLFNQVSQSRSLNGNLPKLDLDVSLRKKVKELRVWQKEKENGFGRKTQKGFWVSIHKTSHDHLKIQTLVVAP
jgi:hypothetical protein